MNSKNKEIPNFIFGLSKKRTGEFLTGLYNGDGSFSENSFGYYTISKKLADSLTHLLLSYGIVATLKSRKRDIRKNKDYEILFYGSKNKKEFLKYVTPIKYAPIIKNGISREKWFGDLYIDKIAKVEKIHLSRPENVYDLNVPGPQNFVGGFGGVLLHNSGHPSFGTMHAEDVETMIRRLESPPIDLSPSLVASLDVVCVITQTKVLDQEVRRLKEIVEIVEVEKDKLTLNKPFVWDPKSDAFYFKTDSKIFDKIAMHRGINKERLQREFKLRSQLLLKMYRNKIFSFKEVNDIIAEYYKNPLEVLKRFNIQ